MLSSIAALSCVVAVWLPANQTLPADRDSVVAVNTTEASDSVPPEIRPLDWSAIRAAYEAHRHAAVAAAGRWPRPGARAKHARSLSPP